MDTQEVLLQLRGEVVRLQELCSEQGRLLRRLRARKGPLLDIPVSLPVQCTEDVATGDGQGSPESCRTPPGALRPPTPPLEQPQDNERLLPSPGSGAGAGGAAAPGSAEGREGREPTWRSPWTPPAPWGGGRAPRSPGELETPEPAAGGSSPNLPGLYQGPAVPEREDAGGDVALVEIRGPGKSCWSPGWALEEGALGVAPCHLCREIVPSGAAEHLSHALAHLE